MKAELKQIFRFIKTIEQLKNTLRSGYTSDGRNESVAEHTWKLCMLATIVHNQFYPDLSFEKLLKICLIHDLGEIINGDIPAPDQSNKSPKTELEREDFKKIIACLPLEIRNEFMDLWEDYEYARSKEARLTKALDKLETIIQHNQGKNPEGFDFGFNLQYGKKHMGFDSVINRFRELVDEETRLNMK